MFVSERENRQQSEVISSLRSEKDSLESALYESQQSEQQLTVRKEQLEGENQELILRKENLQSKLPLLRLINPLFIHSLKFLNIAWCIFVIKNWEQFLSSKLEKICLVS